MNPVGLLVLDKPEGPTSHDMVDLVRRVLGVRRVGHTGTLDPFASGLLLLCVGWTTRLAGYLAPLPKAYRGVIRLGERTDTDDRTGTVIARSDGWSVVGEDSLRGALHGQEGEIEQYPPAYSAKKLDGQRAYKLARAGTAPDLKASRVMVSRLSLVDYQPPDATVEIECSSGTYVRALARDVGEALGVGAHLRELRRTRVGGFSLSDSLRPTAETTRRDLSERLLPPKRAVDHLPQVQLDPDAVGRIRRGQQLDWHGAVEPGPVAALSEGRLVAIGEVFEGRFWPRKVFEA